MTNPRKLLPTLALSCLLLAAGGCETIESILADADKPTVRVSNIDVTSLDLNQASLAFDLEIANPYAVPLPLVNVDYALASKDASFLTGAAQMQGSVPARGKKTVRVPATVKFKDLLAAVAGVRPGQVVPYAASIDLSVDAPAVGRLTLPVKKSGELPVPNIPKVSLAGVQWKELNIRRAEAVLSLNVQNTNEFPVDLSSMAYNLKLGGTQIANADVEKAVSFTKGQSNTINIPLRLNTGDLGLAAFNVLTGEGANYAIDGVLNVGTPFGPLKWPFEQQGKTVFTR